MAAGRGEDRVEGVLKVAAIFSRICSWFLPFFFFENSGMVRGYDYATRKAIAMVRNGTVVGM